jgi:hypothetical protein
MLPKRHAAEDVGGEALLSVLLFQSLLPEGRGELEDAAPGPRREQAQQVAEIGQGLDPVQLAARQERYEEGVGAGALLAAEEQPVLAADDLAPEVALGDVVVEGQAAVAQEALQRDPLIPGVAEGLGQRRTVKGERGLLVAPEEEGVDERLRLRLADSATARAWPAPAPSRGT